MTIYFIGCDVRNKIYSYLSSIDIANLNSVSKIISKETLKEAIVASLGFISEKKSFDKASRMILKGHERSFSRCFIGDTSYRESKSSLRYGLLSNPFHNLISDNCRWRDGVISKDRDHLEDSNMVSHFKVIIELGNMSMKEFDTLMKTGKHKCGWNFNNFIILMKNTGRDNYRSFLSLIKEMDLESKPRIPRLRKIISLDEKILSSIFLPNWEIPYFIHFSMFLHLEKFLKRNISLEGLNTDGVLKVAIENHNLPPHLVKFMLDKFIIKNFDLLVITAFNARRLDIISYFEERGVRIDPYGFIPEYPVEFFKFYLRMSDYIITEEDILELLDNGETMDFDFVRFLLTLIKVSPAIIDKAMKYPNLKGVLD